MSLSDLAKEILGEVAWEHKYDYQRDQMLFDVFCKNLRINFAGGYNQGIEGKFGSISPFYIVQNKKQERKMEDGVLEGIMCMPGYNSERKLVNLGMYEISGNINVACVDFTQGKWLNPLPGFPNKFAKKVGAIFKGSEQARNWELNSSKVRYSGVFQEDGEKCEMGVRGSYAGNWGDFFYNRNTMSKRGQWKMNRVLYPQSK